MNLFAERHRRYHKNCKRFRKKWVNNWKKLHHILLNTEFLWKKTLTNVPVRFSLGMGNCSVGTGWYENKVNIPRPTGSAMVRWHSCNNLLGRWKQNQANCLIWQIFPNTWYKMNLQTTGTGQTIFSPDYEIACCLAFFSRPNFWTKSLVLTRLISKTL